jgi:sporulation protein YlmC with PRC-barrel domain
MTTSNNTSLDVISSDKVEGTAVYNTDGEKLGSIDDLMIDKRSGEIRYAVMEFGGFLGMGTDRYPVPWRVLKYSNDKGGYVVPLAKSALEQAPKYRDDAIPPYDKVYSSRIDSYYGDYH